jgi:hypothetical protein
MSNTFSLTTFEHILACITPPKRTTLIVATLSFLPMPNCAGFHSGIFKTISSSGQWKGSCEGSFIQPSCNNYTKTSFNTSYTQHPNQDPHIPDLYPAKNILCKSFIFPGWNSHIPSNAPWPNVLWAKSLRTGGTTMHPLTLNLTSIIFFLWPSTVYHNPTYTLSLLTSPLRALYSDCPSRRVGHHSHTCIYHQKCALYNNDQLQILEKHNKHLQFKNISSFYVH